MPDIQVELLDKLNSLDLMDLCDAVESTMLDTYGFSVGFKQWAPPIRQDLEVYFKGVMLVPERKLFVSRIDSTIAGSLQVLLPHENNHTTGFSVNIDNHFVAPWGRNLGMSKKLINAAEKFIKQHNYTQIRLNIRSDREAAIELYETCGYKKWGTLPKSEKVGKKFFSGYYYYKDL